MKILSALAVLLAACGGDDSRDDSVAPDAMAAARETIHLAQPLQVGELIEGIMHGGPADAAQIHMEAPAGSLSWTLHGHENGATQVITEALNQTIVDYPFEPTTEADWYLLLRNDGTTAITVDLTVGLYGAMTWSVP